MISIQENIAVIKSLKKFSRISKKENLEDYQIFSEIINFGKIFLETLKI